MTPKPKLENGRCGLRDPPRALQGQLGIGTRQCDSEDGAHPPRAKKTAVAVLRSVSTKGTARPKEHGTVGLGSEGSVFERDYRAARPSAHQARARACSSPENRKMTRQSPRLSAKSDKSAGSDMMSGSQPSKLTFADAVMAAPTPEEKKARATTGEEATKQETRPRGGQCREAGRFCTSTSLRCIRTRVDLPRGCYLRRDWPARHGKPDQG